MAQLPASVGRNASVERVLGLAPAGGVNGVGAVKSTSPKKQLPSSTRKTPDRQFSPVKDCLTGSPAKKQAMPSDKKKVADTVSNKSPQKINVKAKSPKTTPSKVVKSTQSKTQAGNKKEGGGKRSTVARRKSGAGTGAWDVNIANVLQRPPVKTKSKKGQLIPVRRSGRTRSDVLRYGLD